MGSSSGDLSPTIHPIAEPEFSGLNAFPLADCDEQVAWLTIHRRWTRSAKGVGDRIEANLRRGRRGEKATSTGIVNGGNTHDASVTQFVKLYCVRPTGYTHDANSAASDLGVRGVSLFGAPVSATADDSGSWKRCPYHDCSRAPRRPHRHRVVKLVASFTENAYVRRFFRGRRSGSARHAHNASTMGLPYVAVVRRDGRHFVIPTLSKDPNPRA